MGSYTMDIYLRVIFSDFPNFQSTLPANADDSPLPIHTQYLLLTIPCLEARHSAFHASQVPKPNDSVVCPTHHLI